jgi:RNAse (barnase) inhibitor barstar
MHHRTEDSLEIDVGAAKTPKELHDLLFEAFQFPEYYGRNWDAFDECIHDVAVPGIIRITRFETLRSHLPREAELMARCLEDFVQNHEPKITVQIS